MEKAFVSTNLLDLWGEPKYNSERASQLFFAEILSNLGGQNGFCRVRQLDGYEGWADSRFLIRISEEQSEKYIGSINSVIGSPSATLVGFPDARPAAPFFLYYGTRLLKKGSKGRFAVVLLPDGSRMLVKGSTIEPIRRGQAGKVTGAQLVKESRRFLGVPYLWGGISPAGFDCSGFMRTLYGRFGVYLPRDTKDQITAGVEVKRDEIKAGDLIFFNRHVGLAIDGNRIIHSSVGGGGVRINSLRATDTDYRADLDRDFNQARRIL
jgi:cell wall-associated NlpC family hydrolase